MKKTKNLKTRVRLFTNMGGNIPSGNFPGRSLMGGHFPGGPKVCEFCKIFKNTFFTEHIRTTASASSK